MLRRLLLATCLAALPVLAQNPPDPTELERLTAAIARIQAELAGTRGERNVVQDQVLANEREILGLQQQIAGLAAEVTQLNNERKRLADEQQLLEQQRLDQQQLLAAYLKSAWMAGNEEHLKLVLNQQDPLLSARMLRYYGYFSSARTERIAAWSTTLASLASLGKQLADNSQQLEVQQAQLQDQQAALATRQEQRLEVLASLDTLLANRGQELQQLEREKVEIARLLEELRQSVVETAVGTDQEPFAARKGRMEWPLEGRLLNTFGARHSLGDLTWEGLTITGTAGADIRAVHYGRVVFADWFNTSGLLLIIDHGDGYMSLYAHNQEHYKVVGDWVAGGEVIAAAGNTGGQRDHALYFEIRSNGRAENPLNWLQARQQGPLP